MRCHTALCKPLRRIDGHRMGPIRLLPWRRVLSRMARAPVAAPHAAQVHAITENDEAAVSATECGATLPSASR